MGPVMENSRITTVSRNNTGICANCTLAEDCTYPRQEGKKIGTCEDFTPHPAVPFNVTDESMRVAMNSWQRSQQDPPESLKGLCRDCAGRATCTYPRKEGGVWYCDDFREE